MKKRRRNKQVRQIVDMLRWYESTIHPELSTRQAWYEFWRYCRKNKLCDIHTQNDVLLALTELFAWDWVQLIREDFGEDPLANNVGYRKANFYDALKKFAPDKPVSYHVHRYILGSALYNQT